jgi:hypothetical protein
VLGTARVDLPFQGGVLVPAPEALAAIALDGRGSAQEVLRWPAGLPPLFTIWGQAWVLDAAAPTGFLASNSLLVVGPLLVDP